MTLRFDGELLERVSHRLTGMLFAESANVCCSAGVRVQVAGVPLATASLVSPPVGTTRDNERAPPLVRCR